MIKKCNSGGQRKILGDFEKCGFYAGWSRDICNSNEECEHQVLLEEKACGECGHKSLVIVSPKN